MSYLDQLKTLTTPSLQNLQKGTKADSLISSRTDHPQDSQDSNLPTAGMTESWENVESSEQNQGDFHEDSKIPPLKKTESSCNKETFHRFEITRSDGTKYESYLHPGCTVAEAWKLHPRANFIRPLRPDPKPEGGYMPESDERTIRAWLSAIGETDVVVIDEVIARCKVNPMTRRYCLERAAGVKPGQPIGVNHA